MFRLPLILVVFLSFGLSQALQAAEIGTHNYDIYVGDINGDGDSDFYFHGKQLTLILHGDIATPIMLAAPISFVIYRDYDNYEPPVQYSLSSIQIAAQVAAGTLKLYQNNYDFFIWNNGTSGLNNVLLRGSDSFAPALLLSSSTNNIFPLLAQTYDTSGYSNISDRSLPITIQDINYDGRKDVIVGNDSSSKGEYAYVSDSGGVPGTQYHELTPSTDQPIVAGATHVGLTAGEFRVDESGAATYSIPIALAAGTAGVKPHLSLNYSSSSANSIVGQGWSLGGLSSITRCRQTLLRDGAAKPITWSSQDRFCLDGQRLMLDAGTYGSPESTYKTELDSFVLVRAKGGTPGHPAYFVIEAKDGSTSVYGNTTNSKLTGSVANTTLTWSLNRFQDNVGNAIDFVYEGNRVDGQRIKTIHYAFPTINSSPTIAARTDSAARVIFEYENRDDTSTAYIAGHGFGMSQRLKQIRVVNDGSELRRYNLSYMASQTSSSRYKNKISRLQHVQECRQVDSATLACFPGTTFNWGGGTHITLSQTMQTIDFPNPTNGKYVLNSLFGDVNGNGKLDLIYLMYEADHAASGFPRRAHVVVRLKYAESTSASSISLGIVNDYNVIKIYNFDYNADGRQDLAIYNGSSWKIYLSTTRPDGAWRIDTSSTTITDLSFLTSDTLFADVNSDGLVDAVYNNGYRLLKRNNEPNTSNKAYSFDDFVAFQWDPIVNFPEVNQAPPASFFSGLYDCSHTGYERKIIPETMGDFNGDGVMDFIGIYSQKFLCRAAGDPNNNRFDVFYNNSYTLVLDQGTLKNYSQGAIPRIDIRAIDLNGDGLSDLIYRSGQNQINYQINNGNGFNEAVSWVELPFYSTAPSRAVPQFLDFNGDGAIDIAWHNRTNGQLMVRLWGDSTSTVVRNVSTATTDSHLLSDVSGDGIIDYIRISSASLIGYRGVMAVAGAPIPCFYVSTPIGQQCVGGNSNPSNPVPDNEQHSAIVSIQNGLGGITKIAYGTLANSGHYSTTDVNATVTQHTYPTNCSGSPQCPPSYTYSVANADNFYSRLNGGWDLPTGSTTLVANNLTKGAPVLEVNGAINIVTEVQSSAPIASDANARSKVKYYYGEAKMQASGRGFLGFNRLTTVDQQTGVSTTTAYRQDFPFNGQPLHTTIHSAYGSAGKMLSYAENEWDYQEISGPDNTKRYQTFIKKSTEKSYALKNGGAEQGDLLQTVTTETEFYPDGYGNPKNIKVTTADDSVSLIKNTYSEYGDSDWDKRMARLSRVEVTTNNDSANKRISTFEYYGLSEVGGFRGLLKKEIVEPGDSFSSTTTYTYDAFGNKASVSITALGENGQDETRTTSTLYKDNKGRYVQSTSNSLNQTSKVDSINNFGTPTKVTDANNFSTNVFYDAMGNEYMRKDATGAWTRTDKAYCSASMNCPAGAIYRSWQRVAGGSSSIEYFDILGRSIRTTTNSFDGRQVHVDTEYDNLSRVTRQSNPYYDGASIGGWTVNEYDILGRVLKTTLPDSSKIETQYTNNQVTVTNNLGQTRIETRNGLGQLINIKDHINGTIDYTYDVNGGLLSAKTTADNIAITVRMCYDKFGRKVAMHDPDKGGFDIGTTYKGKTNATKTCAEVATSASGTKLDGWWYYKYNGFGELVSQTDTKGQTVTMTYDQLGRTKSRTDFKADNSIEGYTRWFYDKAEDGTAKVGAEGKLTSVVMNTNGTASLCQIGALNCHRSVYNYDDFGRALDTKVFYPGETLAYTSSGTYDRYGRTSRQYDALNQIITIDGVPQISGTEIRYNLNGYEQEVIDLATGQRLQKTLSTNARGQVTSLLRGNGATSTNTYDELTGHLTQQHAGVLSPVKLIQNIAYKWDTVGNLERRHNQSAKIGGGTNNLQERFCYDGLNRFTKSFLGSLTGSCTGTANQTITYDGHGNIKTKTGVGTYSYGSQAGPHAITATTDGSKTYQYDKNGNMVSDKISGTTDRSFQYTTYDMVSLINKSNVGSTAFRYGPDRARWERVDTKNNIDTTTRYLGNIERIETEYTGVVEWKRSVAGALFTYKTNTSNALMANGSNKSFIYNDHLGSVDIITDGVGLLTHSMSFDAWGARRAGEAWNSSFDMSKLNLATFNHPVTKSGFTNHEMIDDMGIIHMNGRIYDAKLGRFLQADPFIQAAANTQSYNRYSYVLNNPLNTTDPSGFFFKKLYRSIIKLNGIWATHKFLNKYVPGVIPIIQTVLNYIPVIGPLIAAAFSANNSFYLTGSLTAGARSFAISYGSSWASGMIGGAGLSPSEQVLAQAMMGGVMAELQGGKFAHGFVSAGLSGATGSLAGDGFSMRGMLVSTIVSGTVSEMTGGKFASGAQSAATMYALMWAGSKMGPGGTKPSDSGSSETSCSSKNPINIATGEKYLTMTDYRAEGASQMSFERYYNSYAKEKTSLGIGWRSNFDRSLQFEKVGDTTLRIVAMRQQGDPINFDLAFDAAIDDGVHWVADVNRDETIHKTNDGWILELTDNSREVYDESGRLIAVKHINGYEQTLTYGHQGMAKNVLLNIEDNFGQKLELTYDLYSRISSMKATDGAVTRYEYDENHNLIKVISPDETPDNDWDNQFVVYDYNNEHFAHAITGIRNNQGQRVHTMAYDQQGRAILSALGDDVERVDIAFFPNSDGTKKSVVKNSLGKTTTYTFDDRNKPISVEGHATATCVGANQHYTYNNSGQLITKTDWNGNTTIYEYNERNLETSRIEAAGKAEGRYIATQWHDQWRLPVLVTSSDMVTEFIYNEQGLLVRRIERDTKAALNTWQKLFKQYPEREWNYRYNNQGLLTEINGPRTDVNDTTHFEYDAQGNRTAVINALGHRSETLVFNERGLPLQVRDANGLITELAYNARGWLSTKTIKTEQGDSITHYTYAGVSDYNNQGVISSVTLPNGAEIHYEYDSARRLIAQSNNAGERIEYSLDLEGNRLEQRIINSTGALLFSQHQVFDELSRLLQSIGADGSITRFGYDKAGNLISNTDALGNNTAYAFDALNRLIATTDAMQGVVQNTYDQANRVTAVTDQRGLVTQYHYDGFGHKIAQISPDTGKTMYGYDQAGNLISKKDARNVVTQYRYDAIGRITDVVYPAANDENIHYAYDNEMPGDNGIGRIASIANASGAQAYRYNTMGQLTEQSYDVNKTRYALTYEYDLAGQLKTLRYPSGRKVKYAYDAQGRLSAVNTVEADGAPGIMSDLSEQTVAANIHYLPYGSLKGLTYGNGAQLRIDHDQNYRIRSIRAGNFAANDALYNRHYHYDMTSNITAITDYKNAARNQVFNYDAVYRLTNASGIYGHIGYSYDGVGNRTSRQQEGRLEAYSYADNSNRLLSVITEAGQGDLQTRSLAYDAVGNIIRDEVDGAAKQLHYSQGNRLQRAALNDTPISGYEYNAKGQRVIKRVNGQVTHFHYDTADQLIAETQASGQPIREYIYGAGKRLAMVDYTRDKAGVIYYMVNDHLGTPQLLLDAQQQVVWSVDQSPFGEVNVEGDVVQPLRFPGQYADDETGYSYNYFRDYDPTLGRYIQSDPIGLEGGVNTFGYVSGNPISSSDFWGLAEFFIGGFGDKGFPGPTNIVGNFSASRGAPESHYFGHSQSRAAVSFISSYAENNPGESITIWGHSWGGNTAYKIVRKLGALGVNVDRLITLDGVSRFAPTSRPSTLGVWVNIDADPSNQNFSDFVAGLGNDWGDNRGVHLLADTITVDTNHENVTTMVDLAQERVQACF